VGSPVTACYQHTHTHTRNVRSHLFRCQLICRRIWAMRGLSKLETNERLNPIKEGREGGLKVPYFIKAVVRPPAIEYKVEYEEKEMVDYRFCHSAVEYEGLIPVASLILVKQTFF
jgi:hypothetical protein